MKMFTVQDSVDEHNRMARNWRKTSMGAQWPKSVQDFAKIQAERLEFYAWVLSLAT